MSVLDLELDRVRTTLGNCLDASWQVDSGHPTAHSSLSKCGLCPLLHSVHPSRSAWNAVCFGPMEILSHPTPFTNPQSSTRSPQKNINKGKETSDCPSNSRGLHVLGNHLPFLLFFVIVDQYTQHEIYYFSPFKYPVELNTVPTPGRTTVCFPFTS